MKILSTIIKIANKIADTYLQRWNYLKLHSYGSQVALGGGKYRLIGSFYIRLRKTSRIIIGKNLTISSGLCYNPITRNIKTAFFVENNAVLKIGDNVGISGACLWAHDSISIGNNVKIGGDAVIIDSDCHAIDWEVRSSCNDQIEKVNKPIVIEDDVLIGARSIVLKGVTIGARSVIGAGSVVVKDIPADCIAAGNPCKVIKYLK